MGNSAFGSAHTFGSGSVVPVHKYGTDALIKMFKGQKPANDPNAYDARETLQYLGPDLGIAAR
jgi:predicted metal-dependent enzyme (double-stranded beta helix superfamily)